MTADRYHRFNVSDYYRMAETGVLAPDARVELLDGQIVDSFPASPMHAAVKRRISDLFFELPEENCIVSISNPVHLDEFNELEPDVMLVKFVPNYYVLAHPGPDDALLLIEVADSSLELDRGEKLSAYGRAGISEVWIVNLIDRAIEVYRDPHFDGYSTKTVFRAGDKTSPQAFPDVTVDVTELLKR